METREREDLIERITRANAEMRLTNIKGKQYADVSARVEAFRKVYPDGRIETQCVQDEDGRAVFIASCYDGDGRKLSTGTAFERQNDGMVNRTSYIENCETSAVGRALGFAGFGIVASIASADEVVNAIEQQTALEKISENEALTLRGILKNDENVKIILDRFGAAALEELTREQYATAIALYKRWTEKGGKK